MRSQSRRKSPPRKRSKEFQRLERNIISYPLITALMVFLFLVTGCGDGTIPSPIPPKGMSPSVDKPKTEPEKVAPKEGMEKKVEPEYTYNPAKKADPFKPFLQEIAAKGSSRKVPLTPLEKYEISQLKLVAIISTPEGNIALIEDVAGKGYFLKKKTGIGKNEGKVKEILKDRVIIEESFQDMLGQTKKNEILLYLHQLEEGGEL